MLSCDVIRVMVSKPYVVDKTREFLRSFRAVCKPARKDPLQGGIHLPATHPEGIKGKKVRKVLSSLFSLYSCLMGSMSLDALIHKERKKILIKTF